MYTYVPICTCVFPCVLQDGGTPLFVASQCNNMEVAEELLKHGADLHVQMVDGATPLFISAQNGHTKMLKFLLSKGANVGMKRKVSHLLIELI